MKDIPSSVISVANNDVESLMKESSTKMAFFISARTKTGYLHILLWNLGLESGIYLKNCGIWNIIQKFSWYQTLELHQMFLVVF